MDDVQILLGRLREAKYKGVSFLVKNSSISFGQKNVVHKYPNSKRTEVEALGLNGDEFNLDLYLHGSGLIEKRNRLKTKLSDGVAGKLIHPISGEVYCFPVRCEVKELDKEFGIVSFSVTFQMCDEPAYPSVSQSTKPLILRGVDAVLDAVESGFDSLTAAYSNNAILTSTKLNDVIDTFDKASALTYKIADKANEINEDITDFRNKIYSYALAPATLGAALKSLFNTFNFASSDNNAQLKIWASVFGYGSTETAIEENTMERIERKKTFKAINDCMNVNALAMAYGTASEIEYNNDDELIAVREQIEAQYEDIKENINPSILSELDTLRNNTLAYLDSLDLAHITTSKIQSTSILLLAFQNYGDISKYDDLFYLNKPLDPAFIQGEVKILSE
jgi:prophage DNA circulation protein